MGGLESPPCPLQGSGRDVGGGPRTGQQSVGVSDRGDPEVTAAGGHLGIRGGGKCAGFLGWGVCCEAVE